MPHSTEAENRAVHIISTPRSGSTAFMKALAGALAATIYSEPAVATYAIAHDPNWVPHLGYIEPELTTYEGVESRIIAALKGSSVVVKDVIHTVSGHIQSGNSRLTTNPDVRYVFLVRDPHAAEVSLSKLIGRLPDKPPGLISYKMLYELYIYLLGVAVHAPVIVNADSFFQNFQPELHRLVSSLGASISTSCAIGSDRAQVSTEAVIELWHDPSKPETFLDWHGRAAKEQKLVPLPTYEKVNDKPTFSEIDPAYREGYEKAYFENIVYYQLLLDLIKS